MQVKARESEAHSGNFAFIFIGVHLPHLFVFRHPLSNFLSPGLICVLSSAKKHRGRAVG